MAHGSCFHLCMHMAPVQPTKARHRHYFCGVGRGVGGWALELLYVTALAHA